MDEDEAKNLPSHWVRRLEASVLSNVHEESDKLTNSGGHRKRLFDNFVSIGYSDDLYVKNRTSSKPSPREKIHHDPSQVSTKSELIDQKKEITSFVNQSNQDLNLRQTPQNTLGSEPRKDSPRVDLEAIRRKRLERFENPKSSVDGEKNWGTSCKETEETGETSFDSSSMLQYQANPCSGIEESSLKDDKWSYEPVSYSFSERKNDEDDELRLELWGLRGAVESGQIDIHSYLRPRSGDHSQNNLSTPLSDIDNPISDQKLTNDAHYCSLRDNNYNLAALSSNHEKELVAKGLTNAENLPDLTSKLSIETSHREVDSPVSQKCKEDFTCFSVSKNQPSTFGCTVPQIEGKLYNGFETSDSESSLNAIKTNHKNKADVNFPKSDQPDRVKSGKGKDKILDEKHDHKEDATLSDKPLKSGKGKNRILSELTKFFQSGTTGRRSSEEKERSQYRHGAGGTTQDTAIDREDRHNSGADVLFESSHPIELRNNGTRNYSASPPDDLSSSASATYNGGHDFPSRLDDFLQRSEFLSRLKNEESSRMEMMEQSASGIMKLAKICTTCKKVNSKDANWCIECGTALISVKPSLSHHEQQRNSEMQCQETKNTIGEPLFFKKQGTSYLGALSKEERALHKDVEQLSQEVDKNDSFSNESLQSNLSSYKRRWLKSSLAWSTFEPQELSKPSSLVNQHGKDKKNEKKNKAKLNGGLRSRSSSDLALVENSKKRNKGKDKDHKSGERQQTSSATYHSADDYDSANVSINLELTNQEKPGGSRPTSNERPGSAKPSKTQAGRRRPGPLSVEEDFNFPTVGKKATNNPVAVPPLNLDGVGSYDRFLTLIRSQRDSEPVPYLCLPDEILLEIFNHLSNKDLASCSSVCSQFYRVSMDETLWKEIVIRKNRNVCDEWLEGIGDRRPTSLTISQCSSTSVTTQGLRTLFRKCSESLEEVDFSGCSGGELIGESILLHISARCLNVTSVDVSWTNISDNGVQALTENLKRLECLYLNGCQAITDDSLSYVFNGHGKSLRTFEIFGCFNITSAGLLVFATRCKRLKTLNIGQCHKMTDLAMGIMMMHLTEMEHLDLRGCKQLRDSGVENIVGHCPIKTLVLANCPLITDASLVEISNKLPGIRSLDICGCSYVTDAGICALAKRCHKLESLDLSSTGTAITGRSVITLSNKCSKSLRILKLSFCSEMTVHIITQVMKNAKNLTLLHLYGCKRIGTYARIMNWNPNLIIER